MAKNITFLVRLFRRYAKSRLEEAKSSIEVQFTSSSNLVIDDCFDDWKFIEKYQDSDWNEYKNPICDGKCNVDIEDTRGFR